MAEHEDDHTTQRPRPTGEGIRIIGAEEAANALETGAAEGRRPADAPRFGDVPSPPPPSARPPALRFPLEEDEGEPYGDTEGVAGTRVEPPPGTRPLIAGNEAAGGRWERPGRSGPAASSGGGGAPASGGSSAAGGGWSRAGGDRPGSGDQARRGDQARSGDQPSPWSAQPGPASSEASAAHPGAGARAAAGADQPTAGAGEPPERPDRPQPQRGPAGEGDPSAGRVAGEPTPPAGGRVGGGSGPLVAGSGQGADMPHWTEPPDWSGLARTPRWRDSGEDWDEAEFGDATLLADEETRLGALDTSRSEVSDLYSFDEPEPTPPPTRIRTRAVGDQSGPSPGGRRPRRPSGGADNAQRVISGLALGAVFVIAAAMGPAALVVVSGAIIVLLTAELFAVLRRAGYKPATLLGLVATGALVFGAYWKGERAVPLVLVLTIVFTFLWYLAGVVHTRPTVNIAATLLAFGWGGVLGCFAALLLRPPAVAGHAHDGVAYLWAVVGCVVVNDVVAFVAGNAFGRTQLAANVSPGKTVEGFVAALVATALFGLIVIGHIHPFTMKKGFVVGLAIAIVAPLGDLCESMVKRDIGLKDMGAALPGHGGLADRFDGMLFALPATYYLLQVLHVGVM